MSGAQDVYTTDVEDDDHINDEFALSRPISPCSSVASFDALLPENNPVKTTFSNPIISGAASISSADIDPKGIDATIDSAPVVRGRHQPPPYVKSLSSKERECVERALVRKIDVRLIPPVILMYILNYLDRNNIASARLAGLEEDLGLQGTQYQTCTFNDN